MARRVDVGPQKRILARGFEPLLRAQGFEGSIAVQTLASTDETRLYLELASKHDFIKGVVGWVDLCSPDAGKAITELAHDRKLVGLRHLAQSEPDDFLRRPRFQRGISTLSKLDLTYDILIYARQLPAALDLVRAFPDQRFVIDHIAKPEIKARVQQPWKDRMRDMACHPNVTCKLSGMVTEADWHHWQPSDLDFYLDTALGCFGPSRLMLASDWPVCLLAGSYERVLAPSSTTSRAFRPRSKRPSWGGPPRQCIVWRTTADDGVVSIAVT